MTRSAAPVHVVTTQREYKGKTYRTHLLRRSYREDGKVKKETLANLTPLGDEVVELIRATLKGERFVRPEEAFDITASRLHGHAEAVVLAMKRLGMESLLGAKPSPERQLVLAMIGARILDPRSKLATARSLAHTTLPELLGVEGATEEQLYAAMDWLLQRQPHIEAKLAERHLHEEALALYDLSSSYLEGSHCPLAARGHNRDGKKGKLQVNYGLLTDARGCPISVSVFKGNVGDTTTLIPQVQTLRERFGLSRFVLVGDRGMITQKQITALRDLEEVRWITALRPGAIRALIRDEAVTLELFDERSLAEIQHPDFSGERLIVCRNPELRTRRALTRESLLAATEQELQRVQRMVEKGRLQGQDKIGVRVGKVVHKYKVAKHLLLDIQDTCFAFSRNEPSIREEAALDGLYILRTSVAAERMEAAQVVRSYKQLTAVERAFRSLKSVDLHVRPIFHRLEERVRAHIFLCMLAYYVQWHMSEALRPLLFADEDQDAKRSRDPVAPATRSQDALRKVATKRTDDGETAHSFRTLLQHLSTRVRNTCHRPQAEPGEASFSLDTQPTPLQSKALALIATIQP